MAVIVPVRNGGAVWRRVADSIRAQQPRPDRVLIVDSESSDGSPDVARACGFELRSIAVREFDHGGTRQMAAQACSDCDVLVYLTQDAELADPAALEALVRCFDDPAVVVAYGRQLPRREAGPIEAHARLFNYPERSGRRTAADIPTLGLKAAFTSNSFCAYRARTLSDLGGFPRRLLVSEDMVVGARALQAGGALAYVADARVYHSHAYTVLQEFRRYFDIGALHGGQAWLLEDFGKPEDEGLRFLRSEVAYLARRAPWLLPQAALRTVGKYLGYSLGRRAQRLPRAWLRYLSMQPNHWLS